MIHARYEFRCDVVGCMHFIETRCVGSIGYIQPEPHIPDGWQLVDEKAAFCDQHKNGVIIKDGKLFDVDA